MSFQSFAFHTAAAMSCVLLSACVDGGQVLGDASHAMDGGGSCASETRADKFALGLSKPGAGGLLGVKLVDARPNPPAKGDNTWWIQVYQVGGMALDGVQVTATPFMPDHGHGTPIKAVVTPEPDKHDYQVAPLNLWMPGLWEVRFTLDNGSKDNAVIKVCIEG